MANSDGVTACIFDLDNTLIDRTQSVVRYAERFAEEFADRLAETDTARIAAQIEAADAGGYAGPERYEQLAACDLWREAPSAEQLRAHWSTVFHPCAVLADGGIDTLVSLRQRGMFLGIITNGPERSQQAKIDATGVAPYVDHILISGAVGCHKPDPRIFQMMLDHAGVAAERALFVGDHPENDVHGSRSIGMHGVWITGSHDWPDSLPPPAFTISALPQLAAVLEQLDR